MINIQLSMGRWLVSNYQGEDGWYPTIKRKMIDIQSIFGLTPLHSCDCPKPELFIGKCCGLLFCSMI